MNEDLVDEGIQQHSQHHTERSPPRKMAGSYARRRMMVHSIGIMKRCINHGSK
jgi:hypothetical protein